jgi:3-dehydroquinate dehydratase/shikimate dehydrogenase
VEVRADLTGDLDPAALRSRFSCPLLYTLRSTAEGGSCADPPERRRQRLISAARHYDFVDLEAARDLDPRLLGRIAPRRRVLSWQGGVADLAGLRGRLAELTRTGAQLYRLAPEARTYQQAFVALALLSSAARDDVVAYARGPVAGWTRVLAVRYGAPVTFGWLGGSPDARARADGEIPVQRLLADYPSRVLSRAGRLFGIIGAATTMSLAPLIHNTAYQLLGLPALFLPFNTERLEACLAGLTAGGDELGLPLRAATVVAPHKEAALGLATEATPLARRAGAASLLLRTPGGWWADNEAAGVVATLTARDVTVTGRPVAVIGCGGGGRAAAAGLSKAGARVTLVNRGSRRGDYASNLLGLPFVPLARFDPRRFQVLVHATPVADSLPFPIEGADPATVIFDLTYRRTATALIAAAQAAGHVTIEGKEMLLAELSRQFRLMTGIPMPVTEVRAALAPALGGQAGVTGTQISHPEQEAQQ